MLAGLLLFIGGVAEVEIGWESALLLCCCLDFRIIFNRIAVYVKIITSKGTKYMADTEKMEYIRTSSGEERNDEVTHCRNVMNFG